jgi:ATP-dependent Clp protease ATP-binding subunit ClpC
MFEQYTEGARRVIFFARFEASQNGSPTIEPEHMLLGLLREYPSLLEGQFVSSPSLPKQRKQWFALANRR